MAIVKAMLATGIYPDFIVVDGAEGGTGAAPLEFSDSLGTPLVEGLMLVQNTLVGAGDPPPDEDRRQRQARVRAPPWPGRSRSAPTCATRPAGSCSRSAASRRSGATPTGAPSASPPRTTGSSERSVVPDKAEPRPQLPPQHHPRAGRDDRGDGPRSPVAAVPGADGEARHGVVRADVRGDLPALRAERAASTGRRRERFQTLWDLASPETFSPPIPVMIR